MNQNIIDAFTIWLSGAGQMKNEKEMWWENFEGKPMTIEFPNNDTSFIVFRHYYPDGQKMIETKHYPKDGTTLLNGTSMAWNQDGTIKSPETEYEDGCITYGQETKT